VGCSELSDVQDDFGHSRVAPMTQVKAGIDQTQVQNILTGRCDAFDYADGEGTQVGNNVYLYWARVPYRKSKTRDVTFRFRTDKNAPAVGSPTLTVSLGGVEEDLYPVQVRVIQTPRNLNKFEWKRNWTYGDEEIYDAAFQYIGNVFFPQVAGMNPRMTRGASRAPPAPPVGPNDDVVAPVGVPNGQYNSTMCMLNLNPGIVEF